jgi:hypothetical protein
MSLLAKVLGIGKVADEDARSILLTKFTGPPPQLRPIRARYHPSAFVFDHAN